MCPGQTADTVNDPPGSKPILVASGQASTDVVVQTVTFSLELEMDLEEYDEGAVIGELAVLYGIASSLISVVATPVSTQQRLNSISSISESSSERLRLTVTILVPDDLEDQLAGGILETDSPASSGSEGGPSLSASKRLASHLASVNSAGGSSLLAALGVNASLAQGGISIGTATQQIAVSCNKGFWCSAANAIACTVNTYQPKINQIDAGSCKPCPDFSQSPSNSTSLRDCICRAGYYDSEPAEDQVVCEICAAGSLCPTIGSTIETLNITHGWYRTSSSSIDIRRCPDSSMLSTACIGGIGNEGPCKP